MITASYMNFHPWQMKREYRDAVANELAHVYGPNDFGAIDAPTVMAAGSTYSYEYSITPGGFTSMPSGCSRDR